MKNIGITHIFTPHKSKVDFIIEKKYNIRISAFPIYPCQNNEVSIKNINERNYLASFIGQYDKHIYISDVRLKILNIFDKYSDCFIVRREEWHYNRVVFIGDKETNKDYEMQFKNNLMNSKFSLCPSGSGPNSIRIWESMSFGSIPVILADTLILPEIPQINYNDIFVFFSEKNISNLYNHLKYLENYPEKLNEASHKNIEIYNKYFAPDKIINTVLTIYNKDII
jgi:hypothetical protein